MSDCRAVKITYEEWLPASPALAGIVTVFWRVRGDGRNLPGSAVLPDGCLEIVLNLGARVGLYGPAYEGEQPERCVVGLLSKALRLVYTGDVHTYGIRFHPARGASLLGSSPKHLVERVLPLSDVCAPLDRSIAALTAKPRATGSGPFRASLEEILLGCVRSARPSDPLVAAAVDRLAGGNEVPSVTEIARALGVSPRQLQRRFVRRVGLPPKRFVRVVRFSRAWQRASMEPRDAWAAIATDFGFADQAHLTREFRAFGAEPPTYTFTPEWYGATALSRVSGPAPGVRSVQDAAGPRTLPSPHLGRKTAGRRAR